MSQELICIVEEKITKANGEIQIKKYNKGMILGKGGFAKCYEFTDLETKSIDAAKVIAKSSLIKSRAKQKLISEIKIQKALHHTNIVGFKHYFEDNENVYILLEICNHQSLNELLKRRKNLTEIEVQCYAIQIIKALKYLHSHRIIHRDLKLGNLFLSSTMELKVGDFGLATKLEFDGERKRTVCGTPNYIAPEILDGKSGHSFEVDVWSLGVIIYTLIIGKPPFETNNVKETYKRIKNNNYSFPERAIISEPAKDLIKSILVLDYTKRPNLDGILASDFLNMGTSIPKSLPINTLSCPPCLSYIRQYIPEAGSNGLPIKSSICTLQNDRMFIEQSDRNKLGNQHGQFPIIHNSTRPFTNNNIQGKTSSGLLCLANFNNSTLPSNEIWVKKWIDYSSKYGLGYVLTNSQVGVYFNDSSKIIFKAKGLNFLYRVRKSNGKSESVTTHLLTDELPKDLHKKVTLLQHFHRSLLDDRNEKIEKNASENIDDKNYVYVKKWTRTKHAILFRLSNKIVQVCFLDQSEVILSSDSKIVIYVNKNGERTTYPLSDALDSSNKDMVKRLKYTKDILTQMLTQRAGVGVSES